MKKAVLMISLLVFVIALSGCLNIPKEIEWVDKAEFVGFSARDPEFNNYLRTCKPGIWQSSGGGLVGSDYIKIKWVEREHCIIKYSAMGVFDYKEKHVDVPITDYTCKIPYEIYSNPTDFDFYENVERYCQETGKSTYRIGSP